MTMFPMPMPQLPPEIIDAVMANPDDFAAVMGDAMEAMAATLEAGGDPGTAFGAFGDIMGPMMENMGISPEMVDSLGDAFGAAIGPAMTMAPADADGGDMGAIMQDGVDMMCPEDVDVPPVVMDALGAMGQGMADAGMTAHDAGEEMMGDPGSDTYLLPTDANGDALVEPGQPETVPADAVQPPPVDGAIAGTDLAPPESGYDHIPMADGFAMPGPFNIGSVEGKQEDGGREALEDSIGVDGVAAEVPQDGPNQVDVAVGAAIDGATEQGGGVGSGASIGQDFGNNGEGEEGNDTQDVDPSAGMG